MITKNNVTPHMLFLVWLIASFSGLLYVFKIPPHIQVGQTWESCTNQENPFEEKQCYLMHVVDIKGDWVQVDWRSSDTDEREHIISRKKTSFNFWDLRVETKENEDNGTQD